jgi:2,3-bisphosphoglycerate-independent phosphoglycerate mutase
VTFFFNDYRESPFPGEDRHMAPSPQVSTYDQQPEMSAIPLREDVLARIASGKYALIVVNFANCDMVGHTGNLRAAIKAVEVTDESVGLLLDAAIKAGGAAIVLADHGNCEQMIDPGSGAPHTSHTTYDVELFVVDDRYKGRELRSGGRLADVAPTILEMMDLPKPAEMTGRSLLEA